MRSMYRAVLASALALAGGGAFAQVSASDAAFDRFYAQVTGVGKQTISYGSGGHIVVGQGVPQISTSGGPVNVDRSIPLRNNSGGQIAANARFSIPPNVLGQIIKGGIRLAPYLAAGVALYDLLSELGYSYQDGQVLKPAPSGPNAWSPFPTYSGDGFLALPTCDYGSWYQPGYCRDGTLAVAYVDTATKDALVAQGWFWQANNNPWHRLFRAGPQNPTAPSAVPATLDELAADIASKSGWPSTSKISQAVADATALQPAPAIQAVPQVTGPATSPGETKTKANPDGSTTTTTTTHNHTYSGPTVNTTTTTVTSTCNGGSCNTITETETPKLDDQPFAMPCGVAGTPACAVKVDETGVPNATNVNADRLRDLEEQNADWIEGLVAANPFPDINWAFELPTACGVIPTPAFAPAVDGIDVCQFQPMFHELMTVVWMLGGLFGAISLFMRNALTT